MRAAGIACEPDQDDDGVHRHPDCRQCPIDITLYAVAEVRLKAPHELGNRIAHRFAPFGGRGAWLRLVGADSVPKISAATFAAASCSSAGSTCEYVSSVMAMFACPS